MFGNQKCTTLNFVLVLWGVCCIFLPSTCLAKGLSDFRLCADPKCQTVISTGLGKISFTAGEEGMVSFKINSNIRVKSKSAGKNPKLWGIEVNGREGYAPKEFIMEKKILKKASDLIYTVPVVLAGAKKEITTPSLTPIKVLKFPENVDETKEEMVKKPAETATLPLAEVEVLHPSPNVDVSKDDAVMTPFIKSPILGEDAAPVSKENVNSIDTVQSNITPAQTKVDIVDGTPIPLLNEVIENPSNSLREEQEVDNTHNTLSTEPENENENKKAAGTMKEIKEADIPKGGIVQSHTRKVLTIESFGTRDDSSNIEDENDNEDDDEEENEDEDEDNSDDIELKGEDQKEIKKSIDVEKDTIEIALPLITSSVKSSDTLSLDITTTTETLSAPNDNKINTNNDVTTEKYSKNDTEVRAFTEEPKNSTQNNSSSNVETTEKEPSSMDKKGETERVAEPNTIKDELEKENPKESTKINDEMEDQQDKTMPTVQLGYAETTPKNIEVPAESSTEPSVTESGYLQHVDPRLEDFDTTTVPTVLLPQTQSPEAQASGSTESTVVISKSNSNKAVSSEEISHSEYSPKILIPNKLHDEAVVMTGTQDSSNLLENTIHSSSKPNSVDNTFERKNNEQNTQSDQKVPTTIPLFQGHDYQYHHHQHAPPVHHNQEYQHQYSENELKNQTIHETEEKTEATQIKKANSEESLHTVHSHEHHPEGHNENKSTSPPYSETTNDFTSQERQENQVEQLEDEADVANAVSKNNEDVSVVGTVKESSEESIQTPQVEESAANVAPSEDILEAEDKEKEQGLFATILGTVNSFLSNVKKDDSSGHDEELNRILFPDSAAASRKVVVNDEEYCEKLTPNDCPSRVARDVNNAASSSSVAGCQLDLNNMSIDMLLTVAGNKMFEMSELLACLATVAVSCLFFLFVYYCFCNSSREGELLAKLNALERSLLATHKENAILKEDLMGTRNKLSSIEDNSFGSNDMVIALKKELDEEIQEKRQLQDQVGNLEKELENAAEAGLELNKIVSELLNNQSGDESIISSVEELQKQLNEQQRTILEINTNLADKSRENSELQLMIAEQNARLSGEIASLQQDNDELEVEKSNLQTRLEDVKREFEEDITKALEGKNFEIKRLQSELVELSTKLEAEHTKYQTSLAKVEALEECLRAVRRDPHVNINQVIDVANVRAELLDMQKRYATLKDRLDTESDAKKLAEEQLQLVGSENEKLKQDFHHSEKDKLEAQTRLEVLSNYFKEKETQLQKELSLKEAMWLKQQGETTSTVDRLTMMQDEIQALKSQNDALRAEIEAQLAAHKAQTGTLENRAHETWLAARQSERRYEEARAEATALRRKLTSLAGVGASVTGEPNFDKLNSGELNNAPSPIHMEPPSSPLLGRLPPPPFLPPPFLGPPPPFIGMPPPFVPPGEMRPPPLGRLMSPPPGAGSGGSGGSGHLPPLRRDRYSPNRTHYDDYDDDEDDDDDDYADDDDDEEDDVEDDEEEERLRQRRRQQRRGSDLNGSWRRDNSYSPPPRAYRSQSPTDSRYNYTAERDLISTYDTETDFEPSPRKHNERRATRGSRTSSYRDYTPPPSASSPLNASTNSNPGKKNSTAAFNKSHISSGSEKSYNAPPKQRPRGKNSGKSAV